MSDDELLGLHAVGKLPPEAEKAIGKEHLRMVVAWDGANGERPPLFIEEEDDGPQYNSLTNDMLRHLLAGRGLDVGGKKAAMIARLQADDLATASGKPERPVDDEDDEEKDDGEKSEDDGSKDEEPKKAKNKAKDKK